MDELQISGKRFISSRQLAREHGYTADYLGQLIRGGKVSGQKVGRAWYVDAVSFDAYLGEEGPVQQVQPEQQVQIEREVVPEIKEEKVAEEPAPTPVVVEEQKIKEEEKKEVEEVQHIPLRIVEVEAPAGLRYYADSEPSLPEIRSNRSESRIARSAVKKEEIATATHTYKPSKLGMVAFGGAALAVFVFSAVLSSALSLNISIEAGNTASAWYGLGW